MPDRCQQPRLCAGRGLFVSVFNICHFSPPLSSALTLAEGFSFFPFSLSSHICFSIPGSNTFSPRIMLKLEPSGALFCCEPGECQDLYPPPPPPPPRRCLANPSDSSQKSPPCPPRKPHWVWDGDRQLARCPHVPIPQGSPGSAALALIPDSFLGPAVGRGILILFPPRFPVGEKRDGDRHGARQPIFGSPLFQFWEPPFPVSSCSPGWHLQRKPRLGQTHV